MKNGRAFRVIFLSTGCLALLLQVIAMSTPGWFRFMYHQSLSLPFEEESSDETVEVGINPYYLTTRTCTSRVSGSKVCVEKDVDFDDIHGKSLLPKVRVFFSVHLKPLCTLNANVSYNLYLVQHFYLVPIFKPPGHGVSQTLLVLHSCLDDNCNSTVHERLFVVVVFLPRIE